jgi:hypothetical protein
VILNTDHNQPDMNSLNCRIQPSVYKDGTGAFDALSVEMCGTINLPADGCNAGLMISILDITDGPQKAKPVRAKVRQWQKGESLDFCFNSDLGKFPNKVTVLSNWTNVAKLRLDWLVFPRRGNRIIQCNISILSNSHNDSIASSKCIYEHDNAYFGYIDLQENIERSKTLAVALAFSVSSADGNLLDCDADFIKNWAKENISTARASEAACAKLEKALDETISFFKDGNQLNTCDICVEMAEIIPLANRIEILDFVLNAVKLKGLEQSQISVEMKLLKDIAAWLEIDIEKFRLLMEKIIPIDMLAGMDMETILGVTSDMTGESARAHLNKEYAKWNSRVTNSDPKIQSQADQMLKLIAEARCQFAKK